ncbi:MAG: phage head-tail connector protein [Candidatus Thiodiazotropha sp. (ex Epidulcina cf. delphinae)]|nr:phage head-tail connector protein [Candidatus Thiodiazotropha sp. (ex Epidulcina cf. delphinae)]
MTYKVTVPPVVEPLTLVEAKAHLREELSDYDVQISALIKMAREFAEIFTSRALIDQTIEYRADSFADEIELPKPPLKTVESVQYIDSDGATQTLPTAVYGVDTVSEPGRIYINDGQSWPTVLNVPLSITITITAGYGADGSSVPETIKEAMKLILSKHYDLDRNDGTYLDKSIDCMLSFEKVWKRF